MGWLGGHAWEAGAWLGVIGFLGVLWLGCAGIAWRMARMPTKGRQAPAALETTSQF